jgi:hypothetical protein
MPSHDLMSMVLHGTTAKLYAMLGFMAISMMRRTWVGEAYELLRASSRLFILAVIALIWCFQSSVMVSCTPR